MDGGTRQAHMSETIRETIKQKALLRRERRLVAHEDQDMIMVMEANHVPSPDSAPALASHEFDQAEVLAVEGAPSTESVASAASTSTDPLLTLRSPIGWSEESSTPSSIAGSAIPIPMEFGSVMIYLDYVFPFLFPFYQPSLLATGRQWLLGLLCQNEVSLHIAASLSAYFFSIVPQIDEHTIEEHCKALVRGRLFEQMDMALTSIQRTVSAISHQSPPLDKIRIMEEITQLLIVEVAARRNTDWTIHLTPAFALFDEIFKSHGFDNSEPSLAILLDALPAPFPRAPLHHKPLPNTADQSALVFFVSLLLFIDIVASTCLGTAPALQHFHRSLLSSRKASKCHVSLESVVGCQNWALVAIGDISTLCAWKRGAKQQGTFSVVNLVNLAAPISEGLEQGLANLELTESFDSQKRNTNASSLEGYYSRHDRATDHTSIANITRIWAHAAKIYLSVSLSGWQTNSPDIQASVAKVLSLAQSLESPAQLRSLSWPICVAGCQASPSQEDDFRRLIGTMGPLAEFGTFDNALGIMEAIWKTRDTPDRANLDIASCLSILGSPALLF